MNSNSSVSLGPVYAPAQQLNECLIREDLPHDFALIHSNSKCKKILPIKKRGRLGNCASSPSIQSSANMLSVPRQLMLKTSQSNRNDSLSAKRVFYNNSEQQKSRIGFDKWKKMNNSAKVRCLNEDRKDKQFQAFEDEDQMSENWLQDLEATPALFTMLCKQANSGKKQSWFSKFVENGKDKKSGMKSADSTGVEETEDSFEAIDKQQPGPAHYNQTQQKKQSKNMKNTFGSSKRFAEKRPVTAGIGIPQTASFQKKLNRNAMDNVCFGTNLSNPRSEVRKIQYCQWYRSHCCESTPGLASASLKKYNNTANHFSSTLQRFQDPPKHYEGPDYYCKIKVKSKKHSMPAHYFVSDVKKGLPELQKENQQPNNQNTEQNKNKKTILTYKECTKKQQLRKQKLFPKRSFAFGEKELCKEIDEEIPKNCLGERNRSVSPQRRQNVKKESGNEDYLQFDQDCVANTKMPKQTNQWIKKSFNVKFQVWE